MHWEDGHKQVQYCQLYLMFQLEKEQSVVVFMQSIKLLTHTLQYAVIDGRPNQCTVFKATI